MMELFKVCPACKAAYLPPIESCADCGTTLVLPGQHGEVPATAVAAPRRDHADLVCIRIADLDWARRLGARLERAGIDHLVEPEETPGAKCCGGSGRFRVMVRQGDAQAATRVDAEQLCADVPDLEAPPTLEAAVDTCPACGDPAPETAAECPSCGLVLAPVVEGCAGCGTPLPPGTGQCPNCGRQTGPRCC